MAKQQKILIVDSIKASQYLYKHALKNENYEVFEAEKGSDAINILSTNDIDIIVLDLNLHDMDGIAALQEIRKKRTTIPIMVLTSYGMKDVVIKAASLGISNYLVKPVEGALLRNRIKSMLSLPESQRASKLSQKSKEIIESLTKDHDDKNISPEILKIKKQIKGIAVQLQRMEKEEKTKTKLEESIWEKEVSCPICGNSFITHNYRTKSLNIINKESDFHEIYEVINPLVFDMWVCPECYYAAKKEDFENIDVKLIERFVKDRSLRKKIAENADFKLMRNYETGIISYELAINCYENRKPSSAFLGSLYLKAAWIAREKGDSDKEKKYLTEVAARYEQSLSVGEKTGGQLSELGLIYLLGEIYRRVGDIDKAGKYFMRVISDVESKNEKAILRMATDQMELVKETKKAEEMERKAALAASNAEKKETVKKK